MCHYNCREHKLNGALNDHCAVSDDSSPRRLCKSTCKWLTYGKIDTMKGNKPKSTLKYEPSGYTIVSAESHERSYFVEFSVLLLGVGLTAASTTHASNGAMHGSVCVDTSHSTPRGLETIRLRIRSPVVSVQVNDGELIYISHSDQRCSHKWRSTQTSSSNSVRRSLLRRAAASKIPPRKMARTAFVAGKDQHAAAFLICRGNKHTGENEHSPSASSRFHLTAHRSESSVIFIN